MLIGQLRRFALRRHCRSAAGIRHTPALAFFFALATIGLRHSPCPRRHYPGDRRRQYTAAIVLPHQIRIRSAKTGIAFRRFAPPRYPPLRRSSPPATFPPAVPGDHVHRHVPGSAPGRRPGRTRFQAASPQYSSSGISPPIARSPGAAPRQAFSIRHFRIRFQQHSARHASAAGINAAQSSHSRTGNFYSIASVQATPPFSGLY